MGLFRKSREAHPVEIKGQQLTCPVCGNKHFWQRKAQLNSAVASFFDFDWLNKSASCFICSECTYIYWFHGEN